MQITFTPSDLKRYLDGLAPGETAGISGIPTSCPIAECLKKQYGLDVPVVDVDGVYMLDKLICEMPDWAARFVEAIDHRSGFFGVPKEEAQQILQECL